MIEYLKYEFDGYIFTLVRDGEGIHIGLMPDLSAKHMDLDGLQHYRTALTQFINQITFLTHRNGQS